MELSNRSFPSPKFVGLRIKCFVSSIITSPHSGPHFDTLTPSYLRVSNTISILPRRGRWTWNGSPVCSADMFQRQVDLHRSPDNNSNRNDVVFRRSLIQSRISNNLVERKIRANPVNLQRTRLEPKWKQPTPPSPNLHSYDQLPDMLRFL
jgi:hypothetical protein